MAHIKWAVSLVIADGDSGVCEGVYGSTFFQLRKPDERKVEQIWRMLCAANICYRIILLSSAPTLAHTDCNHCSTQTDQINHGFKAK